MNVKLFKHKLEETPYMVNYLLTMYDNLQDLGRNQL